MRSARRAGAPACSTTWRSTRGRHGDPAEFRGRAAPSKAALFVAEPRVRALRSMNLGFSDLDEHRLPLHRGSVETSPSAKAQASPLCAPDLRLPPHSERPPPAAASAQFASCSMPPTAPNLTHCTRKFSHMASRPLIHPANCAPHSDWLRLKDPEDRNIAVVCGVDHADAADKPDRRASFPTSTSIAAPAMQRSPAIATRSSACASPTPPRGCDLSCNADHHSMIRLHRRCDAQPHRVRNADLDSVDARRRPHAPTTAAPSNGGRAATAPVTTCSAIFSDRGHASGTDRRDAADTTANRRQDAGAMALAAGRLNHGASAPGPRQAHRDRGLDYRFPKTAIAWTVGTNDRQTRPLRIGRGLGAVRLGGGPRADRQGVQAFMLAAVAVATPTKRAARCAKSHFADASRRPRSRTTATWWWSACSLPCSVTSPSADRQAPHLHAPLVAQLLENWDTVASVPNRRARILHDRRTYRPRRHSCTRQVKSASKSSRQPPAGLEERALVVRERCFGRQPGKRR